MKVRRSSFIPRLPTLREFSNLMRVGTEKTIIETMFSAGCFRQGFDDRARYVAGPGATIATTADDDFAITPDEDLLMIRACVDSSEQIAGNMQSMNVSLSITVMNRQGLANQMISALTLLTAGIPGSIALPYNRTMGIPTGLIPISSNLPYLMTVRNDSGEAVRVQVGVIAFLADHDQIAKFKLATTRWLCSDLLAIPGGGGPSPVELFGVQKFLAHSLVIEAGSDLSDIAGLVNIDTRGALEISSIQLKGDEYISAGNAGDTVPAGWADYEIGGLIFRRDERPVLIDNSQAGALVVEFQNPGAGASHVHTAVVGTMIDPSC